MPRSAGVGLNGAGRLPNPNPIANSTASACSTANKLIIKSSAESNLECIKDASKNPKRLWSKIKSLLHSSLPVEQLSPSLSQPLANSLASFFCQKIVALKESISSKLHSGPSPFDSYQPHAADLLSDFAPVTPAEVTRLLQSMSNKSSQLDYIPTSLLKSCADTFSLLISHLANLSFSQATFPTNLPNQTCTQEGTSCLLTLHYIIGISNATYT